MSFIYPRLPLITSVLLALIWFQSCQMNEVSPDGVNVNDKRSNHVNPIYKYIHSPDEQDYLCINDIQRAKDSIAKNGYYFVQEMGFLYGFNRYEDQLKMVCHNRNINYDEDLIGCVVIEGQTQGCYNAYMNHVLESRFGKGYIKELVSTADSIYVDSIVSNKIAIDYYYCDQRPELYAKRKRNRNLMSTMLVSDVDPEYGSLATGTMPFMDIGFTVELDSTISEFSINNYVPIRPSNEVYKLTLFKKAKKYIQRFYPKWVPGSVRGRRVRVNNNVRISFEGKDYRQKMNFDTSMKRTRKKL